MDSWRTEMLGNDESATVSDNGEAPKIYRCGNCGFMGNSHEMEVHQAILHLLCDIPNCDCRACSMKYSELGDRR